MAVHRSLSIDPSAGGMADARLDMEEWLILMNEGGLYHRYFTQREAKLAFLWSRMKCIDECSNAKSMSRAQSLSFLDFLEALGRVSDMISPPPPEDLASMGFSDVSSYYQQATSTGFYCPDRASGSFIAKTFTRPLEVKITQMLEVLVNNLMSPGLFSAPDEEHLMIKLKRRRAKDGSIAVAG